MGQCFYWEPTEQDVWFSNTSKCELFSSTTTLNPELSCHPSHLEAPQREASDALLEAEVGWIPGLMNFGAFWEIRQYPSLEIPSGGIL